MPHLCVICSDCELCRLKLARMWPSVLYRIGDWDVEMVPKCMWRGKKVCAIGESNPDLILGRDES